MPITDLLASISGDRPVINTGTAASIKRKADDLHEPAPKIARKIPPNSQPSRPLDRPNGNAAAVRQNGNVSAASRPLNGTSNGNGNSNVNKPAVLKPAQGTHRVTKPAAPSRPAAAPSPAAKAPKKGSYAEIMARAQMAQSSMGKVGLIQHKKAEKKPNAVAKPAEPEPRSVGKKPAMGARPSGYQGTSKPGERPPVSGRLQARGKPVAGKPGPGQRNEEPEKKFKKAAQATTGYTGTARPKTAATPSGSGQKAKPVPRGGALLNRAPSRPGGYKTSRFEEDYDEDLDDFIDYDDEEQEEVGGPRYHYDSDGSSDMEAGLDELDLEERQAERMARQDDAREQALLEKLAKEKEERKKKLLGGRR
ncbi:uncharacterized protein F5Z01DRAFT_639167 [Emericellopsis atlantica]|uniref:SPT2 chromatin protein n=1 Tax=Emericellopsis atlantica TaxID=2614577 RepID=A0A9P7ZHG8_9HYPO|nr:uncharacterized protein F5Z01DRAFT_639167 [Emericellopsis atlantica]KAG9251568.1 hypothetical protein F5Z01DRAFT_639167 [Emericellopsis atlantica]